MPYADVNGLSLYYESRGSGGTPLILLHGGFGATGMFGAILPDLTADRRVIAVDLQAHGRTADIDRPMRYEAMADDVAALAKTLRLKSADVMGYSLGGGVALQTAIRHSKLVRRLIVASAPFKRSGWFPDILMAMNQIDYMADAMKATPMYDAYSKIAPRPQDWSALVRKMGDLFRQDYDWSAGVKALNIPVLLTAADADSFPSSHAAEFFALLGGGVKDAGWDGKARNDRRLAVLPWTTHYTAFMSSALAEAAIDFLDEP